MYVCMCVCMYVCGEGGSGGKARRKVNSLSDPELASLETELEERAKAVTKVRQRTRPVAHGSMPAAHSQQSNQGSNSSATGSTHGMPQGDGDREILKAKIFALYREHAPHSLHRFEEICNHYSNRLPDLHQELRARCQGLDPRQVPWKSCLVAGKE